MEKIKKYLNFIVILTIIAYSLLGLCNRYSYAVNQTISENIEEINETKYPGIKERINELKSQYPNWPTATCWWKFISAAIPSSPGRIWMCCVKCPLPSLRPLWARRLKCPLWTAGSNTRFPKAPRPARCSLCPAGASPP